MLFSRHIRNKTKSENIEDQCETITLLGPKSSWRIDQFQLYGGDIPPEDSAEQMTLRLLEIHFKAKSITKYFYEAERLPVDDTNCAINNICKVMALTDESVRILEEFNGIIFTHASFTKSKIADLLAEVDRAIEKLGLEKMRLEIKLGSRNLYQPGTSYLSSTEFLCFVNKVRKTSRSVYVYAELYRVKLAEESLKKRYNYLNLISKYPLRWRNLIITVAFLVAASVTLKSFI